MPYPTDKSVGFPQDRKTIIKSARIRNRIVVLCEGDVPNSEIRTPSEYGKMEKMPDVNFYKACVPRWWKNYLPLSGLRLLKIVFQLFPPSSVYNIIPEPSLWALYFSDAGVPPAAHPLFSSVK